MLGFRSKPAKMAPSELVRRGAVLLDVRTREEFASGHLPGARLLPLDELEQRAHELGSSGQPIVVYCRSGRRSAIAASLLKRHGLQVEDLGAISNWR